MNLTEQEELLSLGEEGRGSGSYPIISQPTPGGRGINQPTYDSFATNNIFQQKTIYLFVELVSVTIYFVCTYQVWTYTTQRSKKDKHFIRRKKNRNLQHVEIIQKSTHDKKSLIHSRKVSLYIVFPISKNPKTDGYLSVVSWVYF